MRDSRFTKIDKNIYYFWLFVAVTAEEHYGAHDAMLDDCITQSDSLIRFVLEITICWRFISIFRDKKKQTSFFPEWNESSDWKRTKINGKSLCLKKLFSEIIVCSIQEKNRFTFMNRRRSPPFREYVRKEKKSASIVISYFRSNQWLFLSDRKKAKSDENQSWLNSKLFKLLGVWHLNRFSPRRFVCYN